MQFPMFFHSGVSPSRAALAPRRFVLALITLVLGLTMAGTLVAEDEAGEGAAGYGLMVDDRALEAFQLSASSADGITLNQHDLVTLLGDEPFVPPSDSITAFAHDEDFAGLGVEVEMHSNHMLIHGLAGLAADSSSPWGVRFPMEIDGVPMEIRVVVNQRLDEYMVVFVDDLFPRGKFSSPEALADVATQEAAELGGEVLEVYDHVIGGYLIHLPPQQLVALRKRLVVKWVTPNMFGHQTTLQAGLPNWALDRVDERFSPLDNKYDYGHDGSGVTVYVLDTGLRTTHNEFGNRASQGTDYVATTNNTFPHCTGNPHGTYISSLIGGEKWGVAKGADLVAMRVIGCNGITRSNWISSALNDLVTLKQGNPNQPMVANLSLTMNGRDLTVDSAVTQATGAGITVVSSTSDAGLDSCDFSPGRNGDSITVGASEKNGDRWETNNNGTSSFGTCLDLFAPGKDVKGAGHGTNSSSRTESGTSASAALVSGMAARYLSVFPDALPAAVESELVNRATTGVLSNLGTGSPDRLLFWDEEQVPGVVYRSHVQNYAWLTWVSNGAMTGSTNQSRRAEAFEIKLNGLPSGIGICYDVDSRTSGWSGTRCNGQMAGTTSQNRRAERVRIWLTGNTAPGCSVNYRVHVGNSGWQSPRSNGAIAGTNNERIEALEVSLTSQCMLPPPPPPVPPVAHCTAIPSHGQSVVHSTLDASGSYDPNGTIVSYQWNLNLGTAPTFNHSFYNVGNTSTLYPVSVTVTDNDGLTDTDFCPVLVECPPSSPPCPQ